VLVPINIKLTLLVLICYKLTLTPPSKHALDTHHLKRLKPFERPRVLKSTQASRKTLVSGGQASSPAGERRDTQVGDLSHPSLKVGRLAVVSSRRPSAGRMFPRGGTKAPTLHRTTFVVAWLCNSAEARRLTWEHEPPVVLSRDDGCGRRYGERGVFCQNVGL
jgi:hypothetical protein